MSLAFKGAGMGVKHLSVYWLLLLAFAVASLGATAGKLLPQAEKLYSERYKLPVLEELISLYEAALAKAPEDEELLSRLAQFWYEKAMLVPEDEKKACFERARDYALAALRTEPEFAAVEKEKGLAAAMAVATDPAALLWYANAQGQLLGMISPLKAFRLMKPVQAAYQRIVEIDPCFWGCSAIHSLGALEAHLATTPVVKLFFHASLEKAREYFQEAIERCPDYLENYYIFARDYAVPKKDRTLFHDLLEHVLEAPIGDWPFWNRNAKLAARGLLSQEEELFR